MENNRITITLALVVLLIASLIAIKSVTNRDPEEIPSRESTQEEKLIEENKEEKIPEEEAIEEPLPIPELPEQEPEEPEIILLSPQEEARVSLVEKYGEEVVNAWERLSRDEFFNYIGYELIVHEEYGPEGNIYYHCYKILEDGSSQDAYVGGNYYIYGVFVSDVAIFDLVDYHNAFFAIK